MSINDFIEMTIFLFLICFSIYAKAQRACNNSYQKWRENNLGVKNFVEIILSRTISKTNVFLRLHRISR